MASVTRGADIGYESATDGSNEFMPGTPRCSLMETVVEEGQAARKARETPTESQNGPLCFDGGAVLRAMLTAWMESRRANKISHHGNGAGGL